MVLVKDENVGIQEQDSRETLKLSLLKNSPGFSVSLKIFDDHK